MKKIIKLLFILIISLLIIGVYNNEVFAEEGEEKQYIYLSDIEYDKDLSKTAWGSITMDKTTPEDGSNTLALKLEGNTVVFKKGIFAHATSTVIYDITDYNFDYFTTYYGISAHKGSSGSVKFYIYTSEDGTNWNLQTEENPEVMTAAMNAKTVKINIKNVNYIKLYADSNGANGQDHAVYADAKLIKEGYSDSVTKTVEEYDELIKAKYTGTIDDELELLLLQRNLVKKAGKYTLKNFAEGSEENRATLDWLMNSREVLKLYTVGGKPDGNYERALDVLSKLYNTYKEDLNDETEFTNSFAVVTAKDLYLKMMLALSLTHSTNVYLWVDSSSRSDAVVRYEIYKNMHLNGKLNNDIFENLTVEEMRWVVNNIIDDEEIEWLNDLMKKRGLNDGHGAYQFITYRTGYNYSKDQYYSEENYEKWDAKYDLKSHNITYQKGHPRLWIVFEEGSVCGGLAKTWSNMRAARGIPSSVVGQPGHAAAITYLIDKNGDGMWSLVNDVSGWANSGRTERIGIRMPNEWGEYNIATYGATLKPDSYVLLAQQAQNEYEKYEASEIVLLLEDVYQDSPEELDKIYKKALEEEAINFDALYGLVMLYKNNTDFTEDMCYELAERIATTYTYHPLPMYDLLRTLNSRFESPNYKARVATLQDQRLRIASAGNVNDAAKYGILQPSIARTVANTILGLVDNTIAKFSFDGENANKIVLSSRFDGSEVRWDYSLDGGATWTQTGEKSVTLTPEEIESITTENDIKLHIIGVNYNEENIFTINIEKANKPSGLYNNDLENRVIGVTNTMEWKLSDSNTWNSYKDSQPDLTGDKTVQVRIGATGIYLPSDSVSLNFTDDNQPDTRKYIPVSNLSIHQVSSEATANNGHAIHAIDGNINTIWHSNYQGQDSQRYIVIKLDEPKYISALEYVPRQSGTNGRVGNYKLYLSMDGENYEEAASGSWANNASTKAINLEESIQAQYVKLQATSNYGDGRNFISALMINLFEDKTGDRPRARLEYSTTESTAKPVVVTLKPLSNVTITNNGGSDTYIFKENGEFTFEFVGENGKTGTATAIVNWMKNCEFSFDGDTPNTIILSEKYAQNEEDLENLVWEYSLDGGETWKEITGELAYTLTPEELEKITDNNNIKLRVQIIASSVGADEYTVDITGGGVLPTDLYANDLENRVIGVTNDMEYKLEGGAWTSFKTSNPRFTGDTAVDIRYSAKGTVQAGPEKTFTFTADDENSKKKYVPVEHLTVESYSSQTVRTGNYEPATNSIDANINTMWHTDRTIADPDRYVIIKLDEPKYISHVQYVGKQNYLYGVLKNGNISVSLDGENWEKVSEVTGEDYTSKNQLVDKYVQEFNFTDSYYAQYIKFNCTQSYDYLQKAGADYFVNASMLNIFEDTSKEWKDTIPPTAEVTYDPVTATENRVTATIRFSEPVNILSNIELKEVDELTYTYTFTENADFIIEYEDLAGNKGENLEVLVNWIKRKVPVANIEYSITEPTENEVIARVTCGEPITITNNNGEDFYIFTENGSFTFKYVTDDELVGEVTATVDWIKEKQVEPKKISFEISLDKEEVIAGEEFTATVSIKDVSKIEEGILAIMGTLEYNSDVLEIVKKNDKYLEEKNDWDFEYYHEDEFRFIADNNVIKEDCEIFEITFKAKENIKPQQTTIKIKDCTASGGEGIINADDKSVDINIIKNDEIILGDVDQDGRITVNDLAQLKMHIIEKELITGENRVKAADIDQDGRITINDLAILKLILIK